MDKKTGSENLTKIRHHWWATVNTVMKLQVK